MRHPLTLALAAAALVLSPPSPGRAGPGDSVALARGKSIAQANCAKCHAIGPTGASPNPKSPPLRTLSRNYPLSDLEEALAEGIVVGHEGAEMPQFRLSTSQIAALLGYLEKIQRR